MADTMTRLLLIALFALLLIPAAATAAPQDVPVKQRICINIHNNYGGLFNNTAQMKADLDYIGIDCIRDALPPNDVNRNATAWNTLDVDVIAYCGGYFSTWQWEGSEATCVADLDNLVPRAVAAEGMNEPYCGDNTGLQNNTQRLVNHMTRIRDAAQAHGLDAYSVALCNPDAWRAAPIRGLVTSDHTYPPWAPSPNCPWPDDSLGRFQLGWYKQYPLGADNRWASTEAGRNLGCSTTQARHAQINVVSALLGLQNGWERFALYQLYDEGPQGSGTCCTFGWWSDTHVKRQVADAFHNMMGYLGNTKTEGNFGYSVSDPANQLESQAFVDGTGRHYVALWNRAEIATRNVTLTLNTAQPVDVIDPIVSSTANPRASAASHVISLGNDPVIVRLADQAPPPPPPPDTDGDGVPDSTDQCPNDPGPASNNGCPLPPPPPTDTDGDGVPDSTDQCPNDPGPASNNGCPLPPPPPPPQTKLGSITDAFSGSSLAARWTVRVGSPSVSNGLLVLPANNNWNNVRTGWTRDGRDTCVRVTVPTQGQYATLAVNYADMSHRFLFERNGGNVAVKMVNGSASTVATVSGSSSTLRKWRICTSGSTVTWSTQTSSGSTWTTRASRTIPSTFDLLKAEIELGGYGQSQSQFDNLNL